MIALYMKKKTLPKIVSIFLLLLIIAAGAIFYLNKIVLPVKLKSFIIQTLSSQTQKRVSLESVRFNLLKGLVLTNLHIYDGQKQLIGLKEASCAFLIFPLLKEKKIIIPSIRLYEPAIFLERKADNTLNLLELLPKQKPAPLKAGAAEERKPKFGIVVSGVNVTKGRIDFQDDTISPYFTKSITDLEADIFFSLPASVKFDIKGNIQAGRPIAVNANGRFLIPYKELNVKVSLQDAPPKEFSAYCRNLGLDIKDGAIDVSIDARLKDSRLHTDITMRNKNIVFSKDKILASLNANITAKLSYGIIDKQLSYSGEADISKTNISGIETIDEIKDINGRIKFSDKEALSEKILATVFGLPIEAKFNLTDFNSPILSLETTSSPSLYKLQQIVSERFKIALPAEISGEATLSLNLKTKLPTREPPQINGSLDIHSGFVKIDKIASPLKEISGQVSFDIDTLKWSGVHFTYLDTACTTDGSLINYKNPAVDLTLSSQDLSLKSNFSVEDKLIKIAKLEGAYLDSRLSLKGNIDITDTRSMRADLTADLDINLEDLKKPLYAYKERLEQIKPSGLVNVKLNVQGSVNHPKLCRIEAKAASSSLSLFGLKAEEFLLTYSQADGLADMPLLHLTLYDGSMDINAKANLTAQNLPFWIEAKINELKLEKLKEDTPIKKQDVAGTVQAIARLNGFLSDASRLSGAGKILITQGKLWELNLFKGLGKLLFTKNFADIAFNEGYCEFFVKDKFIFTENLRLTSQLVTLEGKGRIGFDSSLDASLNVQMSEEMTPESGTIRDFTTALMGVPGRFAVIKIGGTLQKPEYKFKTVVGEVIRGVTGSILENIFGQ